MKNRRQNKPPPTVRVDSEEVVVPSAKPDTAEDIKGEIAALREEIANLSNKKPSALDSPLLKAVAAIGLALATGWWSSYLTLKNSSTVKLREGFSLLLSTRALDAYKLIESIQTDFEAQCDPRQSDTASGNEDAKTLRKIIDSGSGIPEPVLESLREFNNYIQERRAIELKVASRTWEGTAPLRAEGRRRRDTARHALDRWLGLN